MTLTQGHPGILHRSWRQRDPRAAWGALSAHTLTLTHTRSLSCPWHPLSGSWGPAPTSSLLALSSRPEGSKGGGGRRGRHVGSRGQWRDRRTDRKGGEKSARTRECEADRRLAQERGSRAVPWPPPAACAGLAGDQGPVGV